MFSTSSWNIFAFATRASEFSIFNVTCVLFIMALVLFFYFDKHYHQHWSNYDISSSKPSIIVGHAHKRFGIREPIIHFYEKQYYLNGGKTFCGIYDFWNPVLIVGDLKLIQKICFQNFDHFQIRRKIDTTKISPIIDNMLPKTTGPKWHYIRSGVSPVFTSYKMKQLFGFIYQQSESLVALIRKCVHQNNEVKTRNVCRKFTLDTIASCAFGISCDSMGSLDSQFVSMANKVFVMNFSRIIKVILLSVFPTFANVLQKIGVDFVSDEFKFFQSIVEQTLQVRKKEKFRRGDFIDLMRETNKFDKETISAQAIVFILAGYNNTANVLSFTLHLLAHYPDAQTELRKELNVAKKRVQYNVGFDEMHELKLLEATINETLRLYPVDPILERVCTKDFQIPGTDYVIKKGQSIIIPLWSIHHDAEYWPDPYEFRPQRFFNKPTFVHSFVPFGLGPRYCIGMKFAMMVLKTALFTILTNYSVSPSPNSVHPPPLDPKLFFTLQTVNELPLNFNPI